MSPNSTINDEKMASPAQGAVKKLYGEDILIPMIPRTASEDSACYMEKVPGALAFLGVGNPKKGTTWPQHHSHYDIDEDVLQIGAALHAQFALDFLDFRNA
jgi:metal-dependent amidase/aminoacylase/carboxypeptidase family protein